VQLRDTPFITCSSSSSAEIHIPALASAGLPTVDAWLHTLQADPTIWFSGWDQLRAKFAAKGSLEMGIDVLASHGKDIVKGFALNMMERSIVLPCLRKAAEVHHFRFGSSKHHRH
jgi:hypothetical protein